MSSHPNTGKKPSSVFGIIIGAALGVYVTREYVFPPKSAAELLTEASRAVNKTLPKMVDEITRCDTTFTGPGNMFNYNMTVMGHSAAGLENKEALRKFAEAQLAQNYKSQPDMEAMRKLGTVLHYYYADEAGVRIFDIEIDPKNLP